jgi:hypothetical protein
MGGNPGGGNPGEEIPMLSPPQKPSRREGDSSSKSVYSVDTCIVEILTWCSR